MLFKFYFVLDIVFILFFVGLGSQNEVLFDTLDLAQMSQIPPGCAPGSLLDAKSKMTIKKSAPGLQNDTPSHPRGFKMSSEASK